MLEAEEKWPDEKTPLGQTQQIALSDKSGLKGDGFTIIDLAEKEALSDHADSANAGPSLPDEDSGRDASLESESGSDSESEDDEENDPHAAINDNGGTMKVPAAHDFQGRAEEVVEGSLSPTPLTIFVAPAAEPSDGNEGWASRLRTRTGSATPAPLPVVRSTAGRKHKVVAETPVEMASTDASSLPAVKKQNRRGKVIRGAIAPQTVAMPPPSPAIPVVPSARKRKRTPARQGTGDEESVAIAPPPRGAKRAKAVGLAPQDTNRGSVAAADSSAVDGGRQLRNRTVAATSLLLPAPAEPTRRSARVAAAAVGKRVGKGGKK